MDNQVIFPEHRVRKMPAPWAEEKYRFTALIERQAIEVLNESNI